VLSKAEAQQLREAGKKENPTDSFYGIYEAALRGAALAKQQRDNGDFETVQPMSGPTLVTRVELLDLTYEHIAAVFLPMRDKNPEDFVAKLRLYFQAIADRLTAGTQHLLVHVVPDDLGVIDEAA
jgi:hypothetical protein